MNIFLRLLRIDMFLLGIHCANCLWMIRIFILFFNSNKMEINYLSDSFFVTLLIATCSLHIIRWRLLLLAVVDRTFTTSADLKIEMKATVKNLYERVPYLLGLVPNDRLLTNRAITTLQSGKIIHIQDSAEVFFLILDIKNFVSLSFFLGFISLTFLYLGGLPSYAKFLQSVPLATPLIMCFATGVAIYSGATIFYFVFLHFVKRNKS